MNKYRRYILADKQLLMIDNLHSYYGKSHILHGVSLKVGYGKIVAILGRNGMGKTTTLKSIMGVLNSRKGQIIFEGHDLMKITASKIPRLGIVYVPQGQNVFPELNVVENLLISGKKDLSTERLEEVFQVFPILKMRSEQKAGTLSGGEKQMLAIGRALFEKPKLVIMDEPSEGLSPKMIHMVLKSLKEIQKRDGVGILLVEQNVGLALDMADNVYILEQGLIKEEGTPAELRENTEILKKYLGVKKI